jgi:hypothetical protein
MTYEAVLSHVVREVQDCHFDIITRGRQWHEHIDIMKTLFNKVSRAVAKVRALHATPGFVLRDGDMDLHDAEYYLHGPFPRGKLAALVDGTVNYTSADVLLYTSWVMNAAHMSKKRRVFLNPSRSYFMAVPTWFYWTWSYFARHEAGVFKLRCSLGGREFWAVITKTTASPQGVTFQHCGRTVRAELNTHGYYTVTRALSLDVVITRIQRAWRHWCEKKRAARIVFRHVSNAIVNPRTPLGKRRLLREYDDLERASKAASIRTV